MLAIFFIVSPICAQIRGGSTVESTGPAGEKFVFTGSELVLPEGGGALSEARMKGTGQIIHQVDDETLLVTAGKVVSANKNEIIIQLDNTEWETRVTKETRFCDERSTIEGTSISPGDLITVVSRAAKIRTALSVRKGALLVKMGAINSPSVPVDYDCEHIEEAPAKQTINKGKPDDYFLIGSLFKKVDGVSYAYPYNRDQSEWHPFVESFIVVYDKPDTPANPVIHVLISKITNVVDKADVEITASLSKYAEKAQAALCDVQPSPTVMKHKQWTFIEAKARAERLAFIRSASLIPAAGVRGVRTYLEIKGTEDNPLWVSDNFAVWQGKVYYEDRNHIYLESGTSYRFQK
jgi:hypothetical protein